MVSQAWALASSLMLIFWGEGAEQGMGPAVELGIALDFTCEAVAFRYLPLFIRPSDCGLYAWLPKRVQYNRTDLKGFYHEKDCSREPPSLSCQTT
jgi:hypothetical protein